MKDLKRNFDDFKREIESLKSDIDSGYNHMLVADVESLVKNAHDLIREWSYLESSIQEAIEFIENNEE